MELSWLEENWDSVLIPILAALFGWFISYVYKNKSELTIHVNNSKILSKGEEWPKALSISYYNIPVNCLSRTEYYVWNSGNTTIDGSKIAKKDRLRVEVPCSVTIIDGSKTSSIANNLVLRNEAKQVLIEFDYLNKQQGFSFSILHDLDKAPMILGSISGIRLIRKQNQFKFHQNTKSGKIITILTYLYPVLLSGLLIYGIINQNNQKHEIKNVWVITIIIIILLAIMLWRMKTDFYHAPPNGIRSIESNLEE